MILSFIHFLLGLLTSSRDITHIINIHIFELWKYKTEIKTAMTDALMDGQSILKWQLRAKNIEI